MRFLVVVCCLLPLLIVGCAQFSSFASEDYVDAQVDALASGLPADQSDRINGEIAEIRARQDGVGEEGLDVGLLIAQLVGGGGLGAVLVRLLRGAPLASGSGRQEKAAKVARYRVARRDLADARVTAAEMVPIDSAVPTEPAEAQSSDPAPATA